MTTLRRRVCGTLLGGLCLILAGCQLFESLHPSNLWKLNRGPALDESAYFSVADPIDSVE